MANFIFGDVDEIVCSHPTLGEMRFAPKANESFTFDDGGIRNNDDASQITSNGQLMLQKNRVRWSVEGVIAVDADSRQNLNKLSRSAETGNWTFSLLNGDVYKGVGVPVGDMQYDSNAGTQTLKVSGGGELEKL